MHTYLSGLSNLGARILISLIYFMSAVGNKIPQFNQVSQYIESEGVPFPSLMLFGGVVFLVAGSLSVIVGFRTRIGAALLLIFLVLATFIFHDFWTFEGQQAQEQMIQFMKNLSLMGTMIFLMVNGPGPLSLDHLLAESAAIKN